MSSPKLWLDQDHYIRWVEYEGERIGGILGHRDLNSVYPVGFCEGSFSFEGNKFDFKYPREKRHQWKFNSNFEQPTLTPSFLCHCKKCHIFITDGKRVDAGCTHESTT